MRAWHRLGAIAIIGLVLVSACDKKSPTAPPSGVDAYLGEWAGSITSSSAGQGTLHVSLDHLDFQLLGTWASTFPDASFNQTGTVSGLLAEDGVSLILSVQNLFDEDPPFYDNPLGLAYDPANADPIGRTVTLQLTKRW